MLRGQLSQRLGGFILLQELGAGGTAGSAFLLRYLSKTLVQHADLPPQQQQRVSAHRRPENSVIVAAHHAVLGVRGGGGALGASGCLLGVAENQRLGQGGGLRGLRGLGFRFGRGRWRSLPQEHRQVDPPEEMKIGTLRQ